jgi:RHS repeat-associated protein
VKADLYEAFGSIEPNYSRGQSEHNRLANTKERDFSIALDNHGFRYYDPESGRYISRDPLGYPDGLNNYLYVNNNPINRIDPLGLDDDEVEVWAQKEKLYEVPDDLGMPGLTPLRKVAEALQKIEGKKMRFQMHILKLGCSGPIGRERPIKIKFIRTNLPRRRCANLSSSLIKSNPSKNAGNFAKPSFKITIHAWLRMRAPILRIHYF